MATNVKNSISDTVSKAMNSISNNLGSITKATTDASNSIAKNDFSLVNASGEYLRSNNNVAKFSFLFLILFIFIIILNLGIQIIGYFMNPSKSPYIVKGMLDGKNSQIISQNPNDSNSIPITRSNNEVGGIEFTWSLWLLLKNNSNDNKYKNIFNKGDSFYSNDNGKGNGISLVNNGPGLYLSSMADNQNKLHVVMDSVNPSDGPSIIDIDGLPFNKWFHVVIRVKNKILDVYVNGTIASRQVMNFVPKQNYNDINICQNGGFDGLLSNLQYHNRAISAPEINYIVVNGPTTTQSKLDIAVNSVIPYFLSNSWYTKQR